MLGNLSTSVKTEIHVHTCMHIILIKIIMKSELMDINVIQLYV